jgi:pyruvate/oxaloacetate carboxyltransferase/allophanate hydrolase subunit 1/biotin carboxyl carrier protein
LKANDTLYFGKPSSKASERALPKSLVPELSADWEVDVLLGPQEAPEYFTNEDIETLFNSTFEVTHNASRLGVRLVSNGPKPKFARLDGGEGGSHPSNLNDNPYAIGAINFTGDHPVVLTVDGPSLGGFVCPITIPSYQLWKIGQVKPGNKIKFRRVNMDQAVAARKVVDESIAALQQKSEKKVSAPTVAASKDNKHGDRALINRIEATATRPKVEYRIAGDRYVLVEYGELVLDINTRVRIHCLEEFLRKNKISGLIDTIPGVRSLLIYYDNRKLPLNDLMRILTSAEDELPKVDELKLKSRVFTLPLAFQDKWNRQAIDRYMKSIRSEAPYLPENVDFVAKNNGLDGPKDVENVVMNASYLVLGLGDVYLGAPCAVPLDPRHRLVVPKYNPARTFTPEGAVGIGGQYMCIYPMESPGGYQLIGRTLPIWNTAGNLPNFNREKPWLLDMFDQVRFSKVSEDDLERQREDFANGKMKLDVKEEVLDMKKYNQFLKSVEKETQELKAKQKKAQEVQLKLDRDIMQKAQEANESALKITKYLAEMVVNGPKHPGAVGPAPSKANPKLPKASKDYPSGHVFSSQAPPPGLKQIFDKEGAAGFVKAVKNHKGALLTDTTWRDAHQSLLMTRMRTIDMKNIARASSHALANCYSIENWGGATFDVALRFLHECPWDRLAELRELVPNVPFQMLFRGANAVGYTAYPDNVIYKFCKQAKNTGMDVFRIFDSLNYIENMRLGIDAVGQAGGIIEAAICYTGDILSPVKTKYDLEYYLNMARDLVKLGVHVLCIKDMAGLLKPTAATLLISAIRKEFPDVPIHVHTHDTAGTGVASMLACVNAGANAVDCCNDALSGLTAQPAMGAIIHDLANSKKDTGVKLENLLPLTTYWEGTRRLYGPFESGQKSAGADVYVNEIPGGQYTNLYFQAISMGLAEEWEQIKQSYAEANEILGNIVKVTPSSKVVGDLASFMVANKLDKQSTLDKAEELNFPSSVIEYLQGYLGQPHGGFPEPFRSRVLKDKPRVQGRPGADMKPFDFEKSKQQLEAKWGRKMRDVDVMSHVQYPKVFEEYMDHQVKFGNVTNLPTRPFLAPMSVGESVTFEENGQQFTAKLVSVGNTVQEGAYPVTFDLNGKQQVINVKAASPQLPPFIMRNTGPQAAAVEEVKRARADPNKRGDVGAPLPGSVVDVKVSAGQTIEKGAPVIVLSSMKLEVTVTAPFTGKIASLKVAKGDSVSAGDLVFEMI